MSVELCVSNSISHRRSIRHPPFGLSEIATIALFCEMKKIIDKQNIYFHDWMIPVRKLYVSIYFSTHRGQNPPNPRIFILRKTNRKGSAKSIGD